MDKPSNRWYLVPVQMLVEVVAVDEDEARDRACDFVDRQCNGSAGDGIGWRPWDGVHVPEVGEPYIDEDAPPCDDEEDVQ